MRGKRCSVRPVSEHPRSGRTYKYDPVATGTVAVTASLRAYNTVIPFRVYSVMMAETCTARKRCSRGRRLTLTSVP